MTTNAEKRFTAACAAMPIIITNSNEPPERCALIAVQYADELLARLEETAPKEVVAGDVKCEHKRIAQGAHADQSYCLDCGDDL